MRTLFSTLFLTTAIIASTTPTTTGKTVMAWIVKHASWLHNRYQLHSDGKTSFERRWDTNYNKAICEFAETVLFRYALGPASKTTTSWEYGIWLGNCTTSDEHFVATSKTIFRTTTIRRLPPSERYNLDLFKSIVTTPWMTRGQGKYYEDPFILPNKAELLRRVRVDNPIDTADSKKEEEKTTKIEPPPG